MMRYNKNKAAKQKSRKEGIMMNFRLLKKPKRRSDFYHSDQIIDRLGLLLS